MSWPRTSLQRRETPPRFSALQRCGRGTIRYPSGRAARRQGRSSAATLCPRCGWWHADAQAPLIPA